ncbi:hypothetical protein BDAP_000525 [Binucleata daphniae]
MQIFDYKITKKEILDTTKLKNNAVPVFWYETYYNDSYSIIGSIPYLGNFILSFTDQNDDTRVLIRSAYGYREYKVPTRVVTNISIYIYFCTAKYFLDTFEINVDKTEKEDKSFFDFFRFSKPKMISENKPNNIKQVSNDNLGIFDIFIEKRRQIQDYLKKVDIKDFRKIFYVCNDKQEIMQLDKMSSDKQINVILDFDIDKKLFGQKINNKISVNAHKKIHKRTNKTQDLNAKYFSLLELLLTEINYLYLLLIAENEIIKPLKNNKSNERSMFVKNTFGNLEKIIEFEKKFVNEMFNIITENDKFVVKLNNNADIEKLEALQMFVTNKVTLTQNNYSIINEKIKYSQCLSQNDENEHKNIENTIKLILQLFLRYDFDAYTNYIVNESQCKENIHKYKNETVYKPFLNHQNLDNILVAPVQRLTRYSMLVTQLVTVTQNKEIDYFGSIVLDKMNSILSDIDATKDDIFRSKFCFNIQKSVINCPAGLASKDRKYVDYLDTTFYTFFLFNDSLLCTQKLCKETEINKLYNKGYEFVTFCLLKNISLYKKTTSIYKILMKEPFCSNKKQEQYIFKIFENEQTVKFIEKLYLNKSYVYTSDKNEVYLKRSKHDYVFFIDNAVAIKPDLTIRITNKRKGEKNAAELCIYIDDFVYLFYQQNIHKITLEEFYNNFYYYLSNIFEYKIINKTDNINEMIIFGSNLDDIAKNKGERYKIMMPHKSSTIKKECDELEELVFKIRKTFNKENYLKKNDFTCKQINPDKLYNVNEKECEHDLVIQSIEIVNFWKQTLMKVLCYDDFERANADIMSYNTLSDFKKRICVDNKSVLLDLIDHFVQVYKIVKYPCITDVFACLFTKSSKIQIRRFVERISQI